MSTSDLLEDVRQAATNYETSEHRLRFAVTAARVEQVPIAAIAKAAGITRQTVYNWTVDQVTLLSQWLATCPDSAPGH